MHRPKWLVANGMFLPAEYSETLLPDYFRSNLTACPLQTSCNLETFCVAYLSMQVVFVALLCAPNTCMIVSSH